MDKLVSKFYAESGECCCCGKKLSYGQETIMVSTRVKDNAWSESSYCFNKTFCSESCLVKEEGKTVTVSELNS